MPSGAREREGKDTIVATAPSHQPSCERRIRGYALLDLIPPRNCIIGGDFNARHHLWEPEAGDWNNGADIAQWAAAHNLAYIGETGVPTHAAGHVLDLTFSNIPFTTAEIAEELDPGADHAAILIKVPFPGPLRINQRRPGISDD